MDKGKKRERNVNFSREETERLVSLIEMNKDIIENKKSDAMTWQQKEKVWKVIEREFNKPGTEAYRDAKHLKIKYESLKRDTRKKSSVICAENYKTGDHVSGAPRLTPVEQKVREMILSSVDSDKLGKQREKRALDELVERKIEIAELQKKIFEKDLEEKDLKIQMLKYEMAHKNEMFELEKEQMLMKKEILRRNLENKNNLN